MNNRRGRLHQIYDAIRRRSKGRDDGVRVYATSHVGLVRSINQDTYYVPTVGENFAIVADGMGGHQAGEVASRIAAEEVSKWLRCAPRPSEDALRRALTEANTRIYRESRADIRKAGMGTTLTALWYADDCVYLLHVGDSRAYLARNNVIIQISRDHSVVGEMVERGQLTPEEAQVHPQRHFVTRALGTSPEVEPDIVRLNARPGDVWLLCSDGLSNYVKPQEMAGVIAQAGTWDEKLQKLVRLALDRGGSDNITVVAVVGAGDGL